MSYLDSNAYGGKAPAVVFFSSHQAVIKVKNIFYQTLYGFNGKTSLPEQYFMSRLFHDFNHFSAFRRFVHIFTAPGNQQDISLPFHLPELDHNPLWDHKADCALPCATENEINGKDAENLVKNGVFLDKKLLYAPGKASNAGGVAVSGLGNGTEQYAP